MVDFNAEPEELRRNMVAAAERVLASGTYILGKEVENFERHWAETCRTGFAVGVGSGLDAIEIALRCNGIGPGDEVIAPAMTAFATVLAIVRAGATPVLADIDPDTALLCPESASRCLSGKTRALVLVHLYGQVRDMQTWQEFCSDHGLALVEDCAQSHLAEWGGKIAGSFGRIGAYSFYPTKNLGAAGDAGAVVTDEPALAQKAASIRDYGRSTRFDHPELGLNSRLDELHAAILSERLKHLQAFTNRRQAIAEMYFDQLKSPQITVLARPEEAAAHVFHQFVVRCEARPKLQEHLRRSGIDTDTHYPVAIHDQPPCRKMKRDPAGLPASEHHARTCLSIPCHPCLSDEDAVTVIKAINSFEPA